MRLVLDTLTGRLARFPIVPENAARLGHKPQRTAQNPHRVWLLDLMRRSVDRPAKPFAWLGWSFPKRPLSYSSTDPLDRQFLCQCISLIGNMSPRVGARRCARSRPALRQSDMLSRGRRDQPPNQNLLHSIQTDGNLALVNVR